MRKLNLSKCGAKKSPQKTKSFFAMLVLALGLFLGMIDEGKAQVGACDNCPSVPWTEGYYTETGSCLARVGCKAIIRYEHRLNTCLNPPQVQARINMIWVKPMNCPNACGTDPHQNAMYYLMLKMADFYYGIKESSNIGVHSPIMISSNPSCWDNSNTISLIGMHQMGVDTSFSTLELVGGSATFNANTGTPTYGTEVTLLTNPGTGSSAAIPIKLNDMFDQPIDPNEPWWMSKPCSHNCCNFQYVVQKNSGHGGQGLDVFLAQSSSTYQLLCANSSGTFLSNNICKTKCEEGYKFPTWPPFAKKALINEELKNSDNTIESVVMPNPATESAEIYIDKFNINNFPNTEITFTNISGEVIDKTNFNGKIKLNTSALNSGVYLYFIHSDNKLISKGKVTIEK